MAIDLAPHNPYGLPLLSPVLASGWLGYGVEYARLVDIDLIGGIITRPTTLRPQRAVAPQLVETPAGLMQIGNWPNPGLSAVLRRYAPVWGTWQTPMVLAVTGEIQDYVQIAAALEGVEGVAGLALLPLVGSEEAATRVVRAATQLPLLVQLPLQDQDRTVDAARAVVKAGADALLLIGPMPVLHAPVGGTATEGWLAGPALRPLAVRLVAAVAGVVEVPVVGGGGVTSVADAQQFLSVGAQAVHVDVALLAEPWLAGVIGGAFRQPTE